MPFANDIPSGAYSVAWNGLDVGILEGQPRLVFRAGGQDVTAHLFGANVIELIDAGIEAMYCIFTPKNWNSNTKSIFWPWGTMGTAGIPYRRATDYRIYPLVFTAEAGSPAATLGPVTRTLHLAGLALRNNNEWLNGGDNRNIAVTMQILAGPATGGSHSSKYFTDT